MLKTSIVSSGEINIGDLPMSEVMFLLDVKIRRVQGMLPEHWLIRNVAVAVFVKEKVLNVIPGYVPCNHCHTHFFL